MNEFIRKDRFRQLDGLASNTVDCIEPDSEGYIYFCTGKGLSIFDGNIFQNFNIQNTSDFTNNLEVIINLDDSHLLIGSRDKGLFVFDKLMNNIYPILKNQELPGGQNISALLKTSSGEVWIGCASGHLWYVEDFRKLLTSNIDINDFQEVPYSFQNINELAEMNGTLFVSCNSNRLISVRHSENTFIVEKKDVSLSANTIQSFLIISPKEIWCGTNHGIYVFNLIDEEWKLTQHVGSNLGLIESMTRIKDNIYAISNNRDLIKIDLKNKDYETIMEHNQDESIHIISLKSDMDQNLWLGTWMDGVIRFSFSAPLYKQTKNINKESDRFANVVWNICQNRFSSDILFGTQNGGLWFYNLEEQKIKEIDKSYSSILSLFTDSLSASFVYVGTWNDGLRLYDMEEKKYLPLSVPELEKDFIHSISRYREGELFIGCRKSGLWIYNEKDKSIRNIKVADGSKKKLSPFNVRKIEKDNEGNGYWMATFNEGLFHFLLTEDYEMQILGNYKVNNNNLMHLMQETSFFQDGKRIWISSTSGLSYLDKDKLDSGIHSISQLDGYYITDIKKYSDESLYLCSYDGLLIFDPLHDFVTSYLTDLFVYGMKYLDNNILLATSDGVISFEAEILKKVKNRGLPIIRSLKVNGELITPVSVNSDNKHLINKAVNYVDTLFLPAGKHNISFLLSSLSSLVQSKNILYYKMEGLENYWSQTDNNSSLAEYRNLPPGNYKFHVRLNSPENLSNEHVLIIIKNEFWWKTTYAITVYCILILLLVLCSIAYFRKRYLKRYNKHLQDIQKEKEEEIYIQKVRFFTNISHDLKTPLTLLLSPLSELLTHPEMPVVFHERLQSMIGNGNLLLSKINKILNYRNTEENSDLSLDLYPIRQILYEIIMPFKEYAEKQGICFDVLFPNPNDGITIMKTDRDKLESIVENLISNAIKYTPEGGKIIVSYDIKDNSLELNIKDTGEGIPQESLQNIFNRYYRISHDNRGTGIGLYLVKHYVDLLGGEIHVESELGKGSTFNIILPAEIHVIDDNQMNSPEKENNQSLGVDKNNFIRILIVDDNKEMRNYLKHLLSPYYQIREAENGKQAILVVEEDLPDIIISDLVMADMNGLEFCKYIKGNMRTSHIPFIILSAKDSVESRIECWKAGVDLFEQKPFNSQLLLAKVSNLIHSRRLLKYKYQIATPVVIEEENDSLEDKFLQKVNTAIDQNKDKPDLSVKELAENLDMTQEQLYRKLKALTDMSPNQYIRTYRLNCAAAMLRSKKYMVTEVLYSVGFNNPSYFTKCFKKQFGVLPSEYLEKTDREEESVL